MTYTPQEGAPGFSYYGEMYSDNTGGAAHFTFKWEPQFEMTESESDDAFQDIVDALATLNYSIMNANKVTSSGEACTPTEA